MDTDTSEPDKSEADKRKLCTEACLKFTASDYFSIFTAFWFTHVMVEDKGRDMFLETIFRETVVYLIFLGIIITGR